jgi:hypothetical protein
MEHIERAIYDTVHNSQVSCSEIAKALGMSHQVLINKANPQCETHKLGYLEAMAIMLVTKNHAIHRAAGLELELEQEAPKTTNILQAALLSGKEHGDVMRVLHEALSDGRLTDREKEACQKEIDEEIASLRQLQKVLVAHNSNSGRDSYQ